MRLRPSIRAAILLGAGVVVAGLSTRALLAGGGVRAERLDVSANQAEIPVAKIIRVDGIPLRIGIAPSKGAISVGVTQEWSISVSTVEGAPLAGCRIRFDGTMPEHGHGLPTAPRVTGETAPGRYRLEGVRFSMAGHWQLDVDAACKDGAQHTIFDLRL